jgi:hypothetical protein
LFVHLGGDVTLVGKISLGGLLDSVAGGFKLGILAQGVLGGLGEGLLLVREVGAGLPAI